MQTKAQKQTIVEKLSDAFKNAASVVFVHFKGVNVADESAMRRELRKNGVSYTVAKKTLIRRALENVGHKPNELSLEGEIAVAHGGTDSVAAARLVREFSDKLKDKLIIAGGIFEQVLTDQARMQEIAAIPPLATLRAMFAQIINSPRQRLAVVLGEVAKKK